MKRFLLDDLRVIADIHTTCRTAVQGFKTLETEEFDVYFFDHDLGEVRPGTTGLDVLRWALQENKLKEGSSVFLVTQNPVGRKNMEDQLFTFGWRKRGIEYVR